MFIYLFSIVLLSIFFAIIILFFLLKYVALYCVYKNEFIEYNKDDLRKMFKNMMIDKILLNNDVKFVSSFWIRNKLYIDDTNNEFIAKKEFICGNNEIS